MKCPAILIAVLLTACIQQPLPPAPPQPEPPEPPPAPVTAARYIIREYDVNGNVKRTFPDVTTYQEKSIHRAVTFEYNGARITLEGSYQINRSK